MRKLNKILIICFALLLTLCIVQHKKITEWSVCFLYSKMYQSREIPKDGTYVCKESNVNMVFGKYGTALIYSSGSEEQISIDFGNNVFGTESSLRASIRWDQKKNELVLKVKVGNSYLEEDASYVFTFVDQ